jgi:hypothetical protein
MGVTWQLISTPFLLSPLSKRYLHEYDTLTKRKDELCIIVTVFEPPIHLLSVNKMKNDTQSGSVMLPDVKSRQVSDIYV